MPILLGLGKKVRALDITCDEVGHGTNAWGVRCPFSQLLDHHVPRFWMYTRSRWYFVSRARLGAVCPISSKDCSSSGGTHGWSAITASSRSNASAGNRPHKPDSCSKCTI
ncbi:hypothetical protein DAPPUDRAFT_278226 [Daphnia pulex]|uniref:Uncharacterized protein n=1 Tax=Daphnia pulex TaxID=6669 RepID=E9I6U1_DAPPU|nr:hypothetical protein DAPPUDRAFT_278226 [Daphnia pulex]|eukprot:EFX60290.1 hypothetical protein DAPPUDRAFT_278226 [Daphnia pulex]